MSGPQWRRFWPSSRPASSGPALNADPDLALSWISELSRRLTVWQVRLEGLLAGDLRSHQVASVLLYGVGPGDGAGITQHFLADLLGVQRSSVKRALQELKGQRIVEVGYASLRILDRDALAS
jgi:CRP-like cAMP-binding protein